MPVPKVLIGLFGRAFFTAVRWVPPLFAIICLGGIGLGIFALFCPPQKPSELVFLRCIGVMMIVFYSGLLGMFVFKVHRGKWYEWCDYWHEHFSEY
jgi:hypothetical protein